MWEDNGFVLYCKALAEEKFKWPKASDELMPMTGEQINWLLDGYDTALLKGHKTLHFEAVDWLFLGAPECFFCYILSIKLKPEVPLKTPDISGLSAAELRSVVEGLQ
jgi:hypothetical protein